MHPQHGCCSPQSILTDGDAAPAKDRGIAVAIMRLAAQVAGSPSELAALTLDAVAQCLHLEESTAAAASPEGGALAILYFLLALSPHTTFALSSMNGRSRTLSRA